jgi:pyruvate,water dikinase
VAVTGPADPFDEPRAPGSRWTRVNIGEAIPGVPTPLSWSIWRPAMEHGFWWSQRQLGVAGRGPVPPVTGIALGHPCVSVDVSLEQVGRLPGYDAGAFAEQYFGLDPGSVDPTVGASLGGRAVTVARIAARAPVALGRLRRWSTGNATASEAWWRSVVHDPAPADPLALLEEAARRFVDAMAVHTLEGIVCQGAYARVEAMGPGLVSADGELAEARLAVDLWAVARGELDQREFVARHGFHGPEEGELSTPSWREDGAALAVALRGWASAPPERAPSVTAEAQARQRRAAEAAVLAAVPAWRRPAAGALIASARWLVAHRELGKTAFLRYLDVARFAARSLGDDAVWCTLAELRHGRPQAAALDARRARREELQALRLPMTWTGDPVPEATATAATDGPLTGVGASPGILVGRARVVLDPSTLQDPIGPDEVLVARSTDPSWVTLFLTAGALVIDMGGALSHGAIIARELGIPCVIGTGDGTLRIPDGATVAVDGTSGVVRLA